MQLMLRLRAVLATCWRLQRWPRGVTSIATIACTEVMRSIVSSAAVVRVPCAVSRAVVPAGCALPSALHQAAPQLRRWGRWSSCTCPGHSQAAPTAPAHSWRLV